MGYWTYLKLNVMFLIVYFKQNMNLKIQIKTYFEFFLNLLSLVPEIITRNGLQASWTYFGKNFQNNPNTDLARFITILAHCGQLSYTGLTGGLKTSAVWESWAERLFGKLNESCSPRQNHVIHLSSIRFSELKRPA